METQTLRTLVRMTKDFQVVEAEITTQIPISMAINDAVEELNQYLIVSLTGELSKVCGQVKALKKEELKQKEFIIKEKEIKLNDNIFGIKK